ncbi:hypothetical protein BDV96DRAFT_641844 [Lophiotrema nucula]|uniref:Phosphatidic acid phosphatase type 2/haloperoxidase domain-containing protein n=1 Tax=Lophiotrema nucula TaxID=690887 RepID=A0A6A5ZMB8_9PLEO|nr:hypothetical protein BDV96DRAFT_641844 [Lophiotrema nucula]
MAGYNHESSPFCSLPYRTVLPLSLDGTDPEPNDLGTETRRQQFYRLFPDQPSFGSFLKQNWQDIVSISILNGLAFVLWQYCPLLNSHMLQPDKLGLDISFPLRHEYINSWVSALVSFLCPAAVILVLSSARIGKFQDCNTALMALGYALTAQTFISTVLKLSVGGFRPHFLDVCRPVAIRPGRGFSGHWFEWNKVCSGEDPGLIREALMTFPSGHSGAANRQTCFWHLVVLILPIICALMIAGSKLADHYHHPVDIVAGGLIGSLCAIAAYRQRFGAVFDWRYNHTVLPLGGIPPTDKSIDPTSTAIKTAGWQNKQSKNQ